MAPSKMADIESRILGSKKYRDIHPSVVQRQIEQLRSRYTSDKDLEQAVRRKLHQAFGAYVDGNWKRKFSAGLKEIGSADEDQVLRVSRRMMDLHASTRERTGILSEFAELVAQLIPESADVLDIACGLNALCLPAIREQRRFHYTGIDLHREMMLEMQAFADLARVEATLLWDDVLTASFPRSDVAMLLKLLPCLEHQEEGSALELLRRIEADVLLVSYPTRSIGGTDVGMEETYRSQINTLAKGLGRGVEEYLSSSEAFYVLK